MWSNVFERNAGKKVTTLSENVTTLEIEVILTWGTI